MKELSIEEKAKAYDEALERAKELLEVGLKDTRDKRVVLSFFPELAESEDERIRKDIVAAVETYGDFTQGRKEEIYAWLEKQGEQKFEQKFFINDKVVHKATGKIWTIHYYLKDTNSYYVEDNDGLLHHYRESELKLVEQKPAEWSEEDYVMQRAALEILMASPKLVASTILKESVIVWLKSIKDRIQPQPKQEWTEEDKKMYNVVHDLAWESYKTSRRLDIPTFGIINDWLKSLRPQNRCTYNPYKEVVESIAEMCEKYEDANLDSLKDFYSNVKVKCKDAKEYDSLFPQSTWKPSDEQLDSLYDVLNPCDGFNREVLESLYIQLKKLREE